MIVRCSCDFQVKVGFLVDIMTFLHYLRNLVLFLWRLSLLHSAAICTWWEVQSTNIFLQQHIWLCGACKYTICDASLFTTNLDTHLFHNDPRWYQMTSTGHFTPLMLLRYCTRRVDVGPLCRCFSTWYPLWGNTISMLTLKVRRVWILYKQQKLRLMRWWDMRKC